MDTATSLLDTFKGEMIPHFPFVIIPPEASAEDLRREKSFLFLAILASASFADMPLQRRLGTEVKMAVASRMIVAGEMSFELLQGLLVYLAWYLSSTTLHNFSLAESLKACILTASKESLPYTAKPIYTVSATGY
jgi:hypothetical protein